MAGGKAGPEAYQELISQIRAYENSLNEKCSSMEQAGRVCVENMAGDPSAAKSSEALGKHIKEIRDQFEALHSVCSGLNAEMEAITENANIANRL